MKIYVLNGPNLNLLGVREPGIYGSESYEDLIKKIEKYAEDKGVTVTCLQSNHEGALVDFIHEGFYKRIDGTGVSSTLLGRMASWASCADAFAL